jgi:hypothetical protein
MIGAGIVGAPISHLSSHAHPSPPRLSRPHQTSLQALNEPEPVGRTHAPSAACPHPLLPPPTSHAGLRFMSHLWEPIRHFWRPLSFYLWSEAMAGLTHVALTCAGFRARASRGVTYYVANMPQQARAGCRCAQLPAPAGCDPRLGALHALRACAACGPARPGLGLPRAACPGPLGQQGLGDAEACRGSVCWGHSKAKGGVRPPGSITPFVPPAHAD